MTKINDEELVLPRPVEKLPDYAHAKARQTLFERLQEVIGLSERAATAISNAVVDPSYLRRRLGEKEEPHVERISVPGGTLLAIRTPVWTRRIMPDPRNPRLLPARKHAFAVDPGTAGEDSKFRPIEEPHSPDGMPSETAELQVDIENAEHLAWASQQAASYILSVNNWKLSIQSQGVMEAVWLVPVTYRHADGTTATALTSSEGSSRVTATHDNLGIRSADVPYDDNDTKLRAHLRKLNDSFERALTPEIAIALRCERVPALILVGFEPHPDSTTGFPTAVKSLVALRHVDPPKPWGEGPENESLADEALDELYRRGLITAIERSYFAGSCTKAEALAAHLSDNPTVRAARIVSVFTSRDLRIKEAIRVAVTSQSTRKKITAKLMNELATALVLRAVIGDPDKTDQIRRYMRHAFGKAVHREKWESTARDLDTLEKEALREVKQFIGDSKITDPGPASLELAVRGAYALVVSGSLNADRGTQNNLQPDRRTPGEVLDTMRRNIKGVLQLAQALRDDAAGVKPRAVNDAGEIVKSDDSTLDQILDDVYLRDQYPPAGKLRAHRAGATPLDTLHNRLADLGNAVDRLEQACVAVEEVVGNDGRPLIVTRGAEPQTCNAWKEVLSRINEELIIWGSTFRRVVGSAPEPITTQLQERVDDEVEEESFEGAYENWDSPADATSEATA